MLIVSEVDLLPTGTNNTSAYIASFIKSEEGYFEGLFLCNQVFATEGHWRHEKHRTISMSQILLNDSDKAGPCILILSEKSHLNKLFMTDVICDEY